MLTITRTIEHTQERVARGLDAVLKLRPHLREAPAQLRDLAELLEAQCIELDWYGDFPRYETDADVYADRGLVNLSAARRAGRLRFDFQELRESPRGRLGRKVSLLLNRAARRLTGSKRIPLWATTAGMRTTLCKPAMVALLNEFALRVVDEGRRPGFRPRVNSILRTREHQARLIRLGYTAPADSSHCVGYAADIEKAWYEKEAPAAHGAMVRILDKYRRGGILNVIDEGPVWHVCLHPAHIRRYARLGEKG